MNKKVTRIIFVLIILMSICWGAYAQNTGFIGSWRLIAMEWEDFSLELEDLEESFVLIFREDGTVSMGEDYDDLLHHKWRMQDGVAMIFEDAGTFSCALVGDTLKMTTEFGIMVFERDSAVPSVEEDDLSDAGLDIELLADLSPSQGANTTDVLGSDDFIGVWALIALGTEGVTEATDMDLVMQLNEDNSSMMILSGQEMPGSWSIIDGMIHVFAAGSNNPLVFTPIDGNLVVEDEEGLSMIFGKR